MISMLWEPGVENLPDPPYYVVIFVSRRTETNAGYDAMAEAMVERAKNQPGFLGVTHARENGVGITVSCWRDETSILAWKKDLAHQKAQEKGKDSWYSHYSIQISKVERQSFFP